MRLKSVQLSIVLSLVLFGCNQTAFPYHEFSGELLQAFATPSGTVALGTDGIYCLEGKYRMVGSAGTLREGQCRTNRGISWFRIKLLTSKYPSLCTSKVLLAINRQEKLLEGK